MAASFDDALSRRVGQFGAGQLQNLGLASITQLANAVNFFLWSFLTVDPVASHAWRCTNSSSDAACLAVFQAQEPSSQAFCALSPQQWSWTNTGEEPTPGGRNGWKGTLLKAGLHAHAHTLHPDWWPPVPLPVPPAWHAHASLCSDSLVAKFNLVCADAWKVQITNSVRRQDAT